MRELEKDYRAGRISENKYRYLSKEYNSRLANVNASDRIRNMQGKRRRPPSQATQRNMAEASRREDKDLVDKYVVKSERELRQERKNKSSSNKGAFAILAVVCLIGAFLVGISFGLFTGPETINQEATSVAIHDSAFPSFLANSTANSSSNTSYSLSGSDSGWISGSSSGTSSGGSSKSSSKSSKSSGNSGSSSDGSGSGSSDSGGSSSGSGSGGSSSSGGSGSGGSSGGGSSSGGSSSGGSSSGGSGSGGSSSGGSST